jgi:nucleotide-binding universal stress UspA family protein
MHGPDVDADRYVEELVARWTGAGLEVDGRAVYDPVDVAGSIIADIAGRPTGLVAATTHARRGPARLVLGSVAATVVHGSPAPVLLVPPHAPP